MAGKQTGLAWTTLTVDDSGGSSATDIRNDVNSLQFSTPRGVIETTGIDKSAIERLLGLADFSITLNMTFNPTGNHLVFRTVSSSSIARTTVIGIGGVSLTNEVLYTDYQLNRADGGEFTAQVPGVLSDGTVPTWA